MTKLDELKEGDFVTMNICVDEETGYCIPNGIIRKVQINEGELCVDCMAGKHYLGAQEDGHDGELVGVTKVTDRVVRCIRIDPWDQTVTELYRTTGNSPLLSVMRGHGIHVDITHSIRLEPELVLYVDNRGLIGKKLPLFEIKGCNFPLAGFGIVESIDADGDDKDCSETLEEVKARVTFRPDLELDKLELNFTSDDQMFIMSATPVFKRKE